MQDHGNTHRNTLAAIEASVYGALEHYANVHRGSGHNSQISTQLYEHARAVVLDHLGLDQEHVVIFGTPWRLEKLQRQLPGHARGQMLGSSDLGLPVGVRALVVRRADLPKGPASHPGGGTIKMVSEGSVDWADAPDRFEPGTPNVMGVIAFTRALALAGNVPAPTPDACRAKISAEDQADGLANLSGTALLRELRAQQIGRDVLVPTADGARPAIYFDNGASTPTFEPVWQAVRRAWRLDEAGQRTLVQSTRAAVHRFFGAPASDYDVMFAANTSEAIALAASSLGHIVEPGSVVLSTAFEHNSNELPWRFLPGVTQAHLPVDRDGFVDPAHLEGVLRAYNQDHQYGKRRIGLVAVCGASNVMGTCNDLPAMARLAHQYGAKLLVDAAQLAPHRRIRMSEQGIDLLAFSAHKMYAPFGSGGLIARKGLLALAPDEERLAASSGEENVAGIAALGKAVELLERIGMDTVAREEESLTRHAIARLAYVPGIKLYGLADARDQRLAHKTGVLCIEIAGVPHNVLARLLAEQGGVATRSGCFCVNMFVKRLLGIGRLKNSIARVGLALLPRTAERLLPGLVRISFGMTSRPHEIDRLVDILSRIAKEKRSRTDRVLARWHFGTPFIPRSRISGKIERLVDRKTHQVFQPPVACNPSDC
ncbi:MAG TPA: aminotransferase class V-fold PLP-dependent enzyme [Polyangia bacterium]|nr:aminotransferase class V-fold PLP-dependent enzyme [Polyangia bacterium]